jgi:hypothetical protein
MVPMAPSWSRPTDVVEQLLAALAKRPIDNEHALIGASRFRSGDFWVVVFVPVRAFCPGSNELPISLASNVIGSDNEMGSPVRDGVDGDLAGVDALGVEVTGAGVAGLTAGAGAGAGTALGTVVGTGAGAGAGAGAVALGTVTVVVGVVAAPAGLTPANTVAAAKTRPPAATAIDDRGFRLNVLLHSLCMGYTDPL